MKLKYIILILFVITLSFSACTVYKKSIPATPILTQINLEMDDLEYLGEISGTSTQSYFLFFPYGGKRYQGAVSVMPGQSNINFKKRGYNNALYDALMQKPDADFLLPISMKVISHKMFLGREEVITVRAKAFKIITK